MIEERKYSNYQIKFGKLYFKDFLWGAAICNSQDQDCEPSQFNNKPITYYSELLPSEFRKEVESEENIKLIFSSKLEKLEKSYS